MTHSCPTRRSSDLSRHLAPRCDVDALCGAAEVLDMRDPSRTDEERTLGLGGDAWLILVDQHRVELRHRSRVRCLDAEGGIETGISPRAGVSEELILITLRVHGHQSVLANATNFRERDATNNT